MKTRVCVVLLALLSAVALGQNENEDPNFEELLNQLGDPEPAPRPPPPAPAAAARPANAPQPPAALSEEARNRAITNNYGETVEIYRDILQSQNTNTERIDRRIASLENMVADYRPKFEQYSNIVRGIDAQLIQEANELKQDQRRGLIDDDEYKRLITEAEARAERTAGDARDQRNFYGEEIKRAEATLVGLRQEREKLAHNAALQRQADIASGRIQPEKPGYLQQILERHRKLGRISLGHPSASFEFNQAVVRELTTRD